MSHSKPSTAPYCFDAATDIATAPHDASILRDLARYRTLLQMANNAPGSAIECRCMAARGRVLAAKSRTIKRKIATFDALRIEFTDLVTLEVDDCSFSIAFDLTSDALAALEEATLAAVAAGQLNPMVLGN